MADHETDIGAPPAPAPATDRKRGPGRLLRGIVVEARAEEVLVDIGQQELARLRRADIPAPVSPASLAPGSAIVCRAGPDDRTWVYVSAAEVQAERNWSLVEAAFWDDAALTGTVDRKVAGGLAVQVHGIDAFLPEAAPEGEDPLPNEPLAVRIRQLDPIAHRVVLARATVGTGKQEPGASGERRHPSETTALDAFLAAAPGGGRAVEERTAIAAAGRWLRNLREGRLSLLDLAGRAGTTAASLSMLERGLGRRGPTLGMMARLLHALDLRIAFHHGDAGNGPYVACHALPGEAASGETDAALPALTAFLRAAPGGEAALGERAAIAEAGALLRSLRGAASLRQVAEAAGTTAATLSLVERGLGERGPTIGLVARILYALGYRLTFSP